MKALISKYIAPFYLILLSLNSWGQSKPVKIVFDLTSKDESVHQAAIRHLKGMSSAYPESQFELVVYGEAYPVVLKENSSTSNDIQMLTQNKNVSIKLCEGTMKRKGIDKSSLVTGVGTVEDGIIEIITKQGEGWGYIKETP